MFKFLVVHFFQFDDPTETVTVSEAVEADDDDVDVVEAGDATDELDADSSIGSGSLAVAFVDVEGVATIGVTVPSWEQ